MDLYQPNQSLNCIVIEPIGCEFFKDYRDNGYNPVCCFITSLNISTVESHNYAPSPLAYKPPLQFWLKFLHRYFVCTFSASLMGKLEKSGKVRHSMTQIASVLTVATVFIGLWTLHLLVREGRAYIREIACPHDIHQSVMVVTCKHRYPANKPP